MPVADLYVRNGTIVLENAVFHGGILVKDGQVIEIVHGDTERDARETIDATGHHILPGLVDMHVHFHSPGRDDWEGYESGSRAAAAGGVTTVIDMPLNGIPPTTSAATLETKREAVKNQPVVDYGHWAGLVDNNLNDVEGLLANGVIGLKAFMSGAATEEFKRVDDDVLYAGMELVKKHGGLLAVHAENEYLIELFENRLHQAGRTDAAAWLETRPPIVETEAVQRVLAFAGETGCRTHIVHVSVADGVAMVAEARHAGMDVTVETCSHFLYFDEEKYLAIGAEAKSDPPARSRAEVDLLWEYVKLGWVDCISSDHAPCTTELKAIGNKDIFAAWSGVTGVQSMLLVMLTEGVHKRSLPISDVVRMMSANPARISHLYPKKGSLLPGSDADFVLVDLDTEWVFEADDMKSKNHHSPYVGATFQGKVASTFVRGKCVFKDGQILQKSGYGQLVIPGAG